MKFILFAVLIFSLEAAFATDCSKINFDKFAEQLKKNKTAPYPPMNTLADKQLNECPEQLLKSEALLPYKADLTTFYKNSERRIRNEFSQYLTFIDIDKNLEEYQRIHSSLYGKTAELPQDVQLILKNRKLHIEDKRKACFAVDVDTTNMGPPRDQQEVSWCYAYTAADLLSFYNKSTVSAVDVAILYNHYSKGAKHEKFEFIETLKSFSHPVYEEFLKNEKINLKEMADLKRYDGSLEFGITEQALNVAIDRGVCQERDLPSTHNDLSTLGQKQWAAAKFKTHASVSEKYCLDRLGRTQALMKNMNLVDIEKVITQAAPESLLLSLRNANCKELIYPKKMKTKKVKAPNANALFYQLNETLNKKDPVAIGYQMKMLKDNGTGLHASTVIGRKFNEETKKCEYKVRNSWGNSPTGNKFKHKDGNYWVDEATLMANLYETITLEKE